MENLVLETIMNRCSVRGFTSEPLTNEEIEILSKIALASPSAKNSQPWQFTFIKNKNLINELEKDTIKCFEENGIVDMSDRIKSRNNKVLYDAPILIVISVKTTAYSHMDAGIAAENIAIAAKSIGLDTVIIGMIGVVFQSDKKSDWMGKLSFPNGHDFAIAIAVGHGNVQGEPHALNMEKVTVIE